MSRRSRTGNDLSAAGLVTVIKMVVLPLLWCLISISVLGQSPLPVHSTNTSGVAPSVHQHDKRSTKEPAYKVISANEKLPTRRPGTLTIGAVQIGFPDLIVRDQNGKARRFYTDLIKGKVVVLSFFFTSCLSFCPAMSVALSKLQSNLGDRLGKEVFVVSVTKDPETDTPARLNEWAKLHKAKPGWTMVTGDKEVIGRLVRDFTGERLGKSSHTIAFFLGSDRTGHWIDVSGFSTAGELAQQIDLLRKPAR